MADQAVPAQQQQHQQQQQQEEEDAGGAVEVAPPPPTTNTSVRYLRLQHDFRTMVKSGMDCIDEQTFGALFAGRAAPHQLKHTWRLLQQQLESVVCEACAEMEAAASEVGLQQQLEELEGLVLARGLLGPAAAGASAADAAALPAAAAAAARVEVKRAERQQLAQALQQLQAQRALLEAQLAGKQAAAEELVRDFKAVDDQVDKVYKASKQWLQPGGAAAGAGAGGDAMLP